MTTTITKSLLAAGVLAGTALATLPASAMPLQHDQGAHSMLQLASWGDRVRGRTSSSTGEVGYGYGYGYRGPYAGYNGYGYQRAPYGYDQAPVDYDGGYGYGAY